MEHVPTEQDETRNNDLKQRVCIHCDNYDVENVHRDKQHEEFIKVVSVVRWNVRKDNNRVYNWHDVSPPMEAFDAPAIDQPNYSQDDCYPYIEIHLSIVLLMVTSEALIYDLHLRVVVPENLFCFFESRKHLGNTK